MPNEDNSNTDLHLLIKVKVGEELWLSVRLHWSLVPWAAWHQRILCFLITEEHILDTYAGKQLSETATDVYVTLVLKKWTQFKYRLEFWQPDASE
jgi:hypothetical protein